ncbi:hypothetical protein NQZ68_016751, partial [Dissostichus eleginoides]
MAVISRRGVSTAGDVTGSSDSAVSRVALQMIDSSYRACFPELSLCLLSCERLSGQQTKRTDTPFDQAVSATSGIMSLQEKRLEGGVCE